jgi:hypothetical protein
MFTGINTDELIPKRLGKKLVISAHAFILVAYFALLRKYYFLSVSLMMIYLSSFWHWNHPKKNSIARKFDIMCVINGILCGTYHATILSNIIHVWLSVVVVIVAGFVINGIIFEYRCSLPDDYIRKINQSLIHPQDRIVKVFYTVLSIKLDATLPMTLERENAYQHSVYAHMFFVHLVPTTVSIYCLIYGYPIYDECV